MPLLKVPLPAVESPSKMSTLLLVKVASPAVAVLVKFKKALLVKVALSAVEVLPKVMVPKLVKSVKLPAVALLRNIICAAPRLTTKCCTIPELFVMPTPLMVISGTPAGLLAIVNALAPGLNTMPLTSTLNAMSMLVRLEDPNVAVSPGALGMVPCTQLFAVNHSALAAFAFQVALPAKLLLVVESRNVRIAAAEGRKAHVRGPRNDCFLRRAVEA